MPSQRSPQPDGNELIDTTTAAILARHPAITRPDVWAGVAASYRRLTPDTRIPHHLGVLVQHEATDRLRNAAAEPGDNTVTTCT